MIDDRNVYIDELQRDLVELHSLLTPKQKEKLAKRKLARQIKRDTASKSAHILSSDELRRQIANIVEKSFPENVKGKKC